MKGQRFFRDNEFSQHEGRFYEILCRFELDKVFLGDKMSRE